MSRKAWRNWHHCMAGTYAQWLPGDERGWRERDHHEHVEGDYKNPPKPTNFADKRREYARKLLRGEPYLIPPADREPIARLLLASFTHQKIPVLALAVCPKNFHALIHGPSERMKKILGEAKKHVTFQFSPIINDATRERRKIWEADGCSKPVRDRAHAVNVFHYVLDHEKEGGWIWQFRDMIE